jgi:hypothetical protein
MTVATRLSIDRSRIEGVGVFAAQTYQWGDSILSFRESLPVPDVRRLSIQVSTHAHIEPRPQVLQRVNHSCTPNARFDVERFEFVAISKVNPGDELTVFYPATEWRMCAEFVCFCGSPLCLGLIRGAAHVPERVLRRHQPAQHVVELAGLNERSNRPRMRGM